LEGQARTVFVGEYDRSVDGNGRLALPSPFREELGDRCYVTADPIGFVSITPVANFEADAQRLMEEVRDGLLPASAMRNFGVSSSVVSVDKQGRITLDEETRQFAGITPGGQAIVAGALKQLEVWRPSRYRTIRGEDVVVQPTRTWNDEDDR
jgi:MraZ protein